jgi:hypothetical protein
MESTAQHAAQMRREAAWEVTISPIELPVTIDREICSKNFDDMQFGPP